MTRARRECGLYMTSKNKYKDAVVKHPNFSGSCVLRACMHAGCTLFFLPPAFPLLARAPTESERTSGAHTQERHAAWLSHHTYVQLPHGCRHSCAPLSPLYSLKTGHKTQHLALKIASAQSGGRKTSRAGALSCVDKESRALRRRGSLVASVPRAPSCVSKRA